MSTLQTNVEYLSNRIISRDSQLNENKMNQDNEGMANIYEISRRQWVSHSLIFVRYNTIYWFSTIFVFFFFFYHLILVIQLHHVQFGSLAIRQYYCLVNVSFLIIPFLTYLRHKL